MKYITRDLAYDKNVKKSLLVKFCLRYSGYQNVSLDVRPLAEYAAPVWHPGLKSAALERIQKRACMIIMGRQNTTYVDALEICNLDTLHARREQLSLNFFKSLMKSEHFSSWIPHSRGSVHQRNLRNSNKL